MRGVERSSADCPEDDRGLGGRHLSESQRAMVAKKIANMKSGARTDLAHKCARSGVSHQDAADRLNVSERSHAVEASEVREA